LRTKIEHIQQLMSSVNINKLCDDYKSMQSDQLIYGLRKAYPNNTNFIATQILYHQKAKIKLPKFISNGCWLTSKSYEQSSSEATATFKASLFEGNNILDLTGGLGIDDIAFSKVFANVHSIDIDEELNAIVQSNVHKMGIGNIHRITNAAEVFIRDNQEKFDLIYADADRRLDKHAKLFLLTDIQPNLMELLPMMKKVSSKILLKLSPMLDLTLLRKQLPEISQIIVVSLEGEVKELLCIIDTSASINECLIEAVEIDESGSILSRYHNQASKPYHTISYACQPQTALFFYEPASVLVKSGLHHSYINQFGLHPISPNSIYTMGNQYINGFFGRAFQLVGAIKFNKKNTASYLTQHQIKYANIAKRDFINDVVELKNTFDIIDGGSDYLFFTTDHTKQKWMFHCKKINPSEALQ